MLRSNRVHLWLGAFSILQILAALVIAFGDIGFDHPGRFGLSFDHFVAFSVIFGLAAVVQLAIEISTRNSAMLVVHFMFLLLSVGYILWDAW